MSLYVCVTDQILNRREDTHTSCHFNKRSPCSEMFWIHINLTFLEMACSAKSASHLALVQVLVSPIFSLHMQQQRQALSRLPLLPAPSKHVTVATCLQQGPRPARLVCTYTAWRQYLFTLCGNVAESTWVKSTEEKNVWITPLHVLFFFFFKLHCAL